VTPQEMVYRAAEAAGVLVSGNTEARTDHAAVAAEVRARLEHGLRVDESIRAQLRAKYTTNPALSLSFERRVYNEVTGEHVVKTDQNAVTDFTDHLMAQAQAERIGQLAAVWGPGGPQNEAAERIQAAQDARYAAAQAEMARMNAHLPPGSPR
jgi:hypothetical protein